MHRTFLLLPALAALGLLTACGADDGSDAGGAPPASGITVVATDWNGWDRDHEPTPVTRTLSAEEGASVSVPCPVGGPVEVSVESVDGEGAVLRTDDDMAPEGETGGADLNDLTDRFELPAGDAVRFDTPTLDAGCGFEVTWA
jgi:hypothetical protein